MQESNFPKNKNNQYWNGYRYNSYNKFDNDTKHDNNKNYKQKDEVKKNEEKEILDRRKRFEKYDRIKKINLSQRKNVGIAVHWDISDQNIPHWFRRKTGINRAFRGELDCKK